MGQRTSRNTRRKIITIRAAISPNILTERETEYRSHWVDAGIRSPVKEKSKTTKEQDRRAGKARISPAKRE